MTRRIPEGAPILTAEAMRAAEDAAFARGVLQDALMEAAGLAVARAARRLAGSHAILVLAGPGNNGGDAYVAARHLADWGHEVSVATMGDAKSGAAARMAALWRGETNPIADVAPRPILIDGLFGTGMVRPLDPALARLVGHLTVAIDVPSGIDADGAESTTPLPADIIVALGALKPAHLIGNGACGDVVLADIGLPVTSRWISLARPHLSAPKADAQKYSRGMVVVVAGAMPGAAALAAQAALRGGAGYVVLAGEHAPSGVAHALVHRADHLAGLLDDDRIGAVVIGPGLGRDAAARARLDVVLRSKRDLVIDGDALSLLGRDVAARIDAGRRRVYLTPHLGEFARMFEREVSKIDQTLAAAMESGATILHKGPATVIADADGRVVVSAGASPWLSTAGTGDVLAGLVAARHVAGGGAAAAVWLHARAAALAGPAFAADDLLAHLAPAIGECL